MGEIKSVKVDNWGVFFLQKLQNFFNKTDYCDLTLQFNDNSQLKVHRLVLSACTDYFNVLEQTCEMIDDVLIMPPGLQADVVVPIVNFMYTGTLEFELKMYGRLLKTAKDMNMTVLLKLLEAHRRTMEGTRPQPGARTAPKTLRRLPTNNTPAKTTIVERTYNSPSTSTNQRRTQATYTTPQYRTLQIKPLSQNYYSNTLSDSNQILTKYPQTKIVKGPSRFECNDDSMPLETFERSFDNISYESKPLIKEEPDAYDYDNLIRKHETYASPFEQLRRGYTNNNNKRPASIVSSYESPPDKKPNIQDVKEYAEEQRVRKQIAEQFDDDNEYDEVLDDEFQNDDDDDDYVPPPSYQKQLKQQQAEQQAKQVQRQHEQPQKSDRNVTTKQQNNNHRSTIVVKDTTSANVNHAKIISEVLRKYPHLVKNNKNIKLKIMPQKNNAKTDSGDETKESSKETTKTIIVKESTNASSKTTSSASTSCSQVAASSIITANAVQAPPRRIDSKTMHTLIALGAENRTGPWLCLRCGVNGRPISIPSYRGFRRHLINIHKEKIDPRLCEHCGWRSVNNRELAFHMLTDHSIKPPPTYEFPQCEHCKQHMLGYEALEEHFVEKHPDKKYQNQVCIYCSKRFSREIDLYTHMKLAHRERALDDGVLSEEEEVPFEESDVETNHNNNTSKEKIKIISDISLTKNNPIMQPSDSNTIVTPMELEPSSEAEGLNNVATGIAASLGLIDNPAVVEETQIITNEYVGIDSSSQGPKFVNAEGNEMDLTPAQREEIISQLDQQHDGVVMVLNDETFVSNDEVADGQTVTATSTQFSGENMFIVYNESSDTAQSVPAAMSTTKRRTSVERDWDDKESNADDADKSGVDNEHSEDSQNKDEESEKSKDLLDNLSRETENDDKSTKMDKDSKTTSRDSLDMKLKLLTDWTDDEDDYGKVSQENKNDLTEKEDKNDEEKHNNEEILFETIAHVEGVENEIKDPSFKNYEEKSDNEDNQSKEMNSLSEIDKTDEIDNKDVDEDNELKDMDKNEASDQQESEPEATTDKITEKETEKSKEAKSDKSTEGSKVKTDSDKKSDTSLITKAELRNLISDWGDDEDEDEEV